MSFPSNKLESPEPVLISVCADQKTIDQLEATMVKRFWKNGLSIFDSYIFSAKRPYFSPLIKSADACIAFVDFDKSEELAVEATQYLTQIFAGRITIIAIAKSDSPDKILVAMRAGCTDFLTTPLQEIDLTTIFDRLERQWLSTRWFPPQTGSVLSFFGVKGGAGSTTLAVHVAAYLAKYHNKKTLLIDHHPELGHVCVYLGMDGTRYQFQELIRNVNRLDSELLHGFVIKHASGLDVLSSPDTSVGKNYLDEEAVAKTLDFLRSEYDYIIIDCNIDCEEHNLPVISASQHIYMVSTQEVGSIRNLSRYIDRFSLLDAPLEKLQIVLNHISSSDAIQVDQIEKAMKLPIAIRIPNSIEFVRAANLGEPLFVDGKSSLTGKLVKWVEAIAGSPPPLEAASVKKSKTLMSMWK
ncbi:AAA family ATPase [Acidicapsa ligni]|uniref:AAA family ATPase n=1 Tax=Acidicapsa ligni TaxID=542300 RepID=UPI0021E03383|nr:AAA family ATPase [Acidicapsa ligni]